MKIHTEELYNLYMEWVDKVPDEKSTFTPKEIVNAIVNIIESNPSLIELPSDEEIDEECRKLPYEKHLDDGQYNDGQMVGFELGAYWMRQKILNQNK